MRFHRFERWAVVAAGLVATSGQAQTPPSAPAPAPVFLAHPTVIDTAHLRGDGTVVTLQGVQGWGGDPAQQLQSLIEQAGDKITCQPHGDGTYVCNLPSGADVGELAVATGAAKALDDAPANYKTQQSAAESGHRGLWASDLPGPAILQHPAVRTTAELAANSRVYPLDGLIGFDALYYTLQLQNYIDSHGNELSCQPKGNTGRYVCLLPSGADIASVALLQGLARVTADASPGERADQAQAIRTRSGFWFNPPQSILTQVTPASGFEPPPQFNVVAPSTLAPEPNGTLAPELSYDDGIPVAVIDNVPAFFIFIREIGWGYYDRSGSWHLAPERYRTQLARSFPHGPPDAPIGRANASLAANPVRGPAATGPAGFVNTPREFGQGGVGRVPASTVLLRGPAAFSTRAPGIRLRPIAPFPLGQAGLVAERGPHPPGPALMAPFSAGRR